MRCRAAASGRAASIVSRVSGRALAAAGRQYLTSVLERFSLLLNQSMISRLAAQKAIQRRSLDEVAVGQVRRGQIQRSSLNGCW